MRLINEEIILFDEFKMLAPNKLNSHSPNWYKNLTNRSSYCGVKIPNDDVLVLNGDPHDALELECMVMKWGKPNPWIPDVNSENLIGLEYFIDIKQAFSNEKLLGDPILIPVSHVSLKGIDHNHSRHSQGKILTLAGFFSYTEDYNYQGFSFLKDGDSLVYIEWDDHGEWMSGWNYSEKLKKYFSLWKL